MRNKYLIYPLYIDQLSLAVKDNTKMCELPGQHESINKKKKKHVYK